MKYLEITLKDEIVEGRPESSIFSRRTKVDIKTVLDYIDRARTDRRIAGLVLKLKQPVWGWALIENLRAALARFRATQKPLIAFMESGGAATYMLACACDTIILPPSSPLDLTGLHAEAFFFKGVFDVLGVQPEFVRAGKYKSAPEMFTRESMSEAAREEQNLLLDDLFDQIIQAIAAGRKQTPAAVRQLIDNGPFTAQEARQANLIDRVGYEDEVEAIMQERLSGPAKPLPWDRYRIRPSWIRRLFRRRAPQIGVIHVVGLIASGESRRLPNQLAVTGSDTAVALLRAAAENPRIRAIVLRINSPGGSVLASDLIWHQSMKAREKKPIIVSFGNVAASGGYYIAVAGDKIVAEPTTITGSIGVYGGKFVIRELLSMLGINQELLVRGAHGAMDSLLKPYSPSEWQKLEKQVQEFYYTDFVKKVAEGRRMAEEAVEKIAQGRVWTGLRGKALGLVDELGGIERALELAKAAANIPPDQKAQPVYFSRRRTWRDRIIGSVGVQQSVWHAIPPLAWLATWWELYRDEEVLALMPYPFHVW